MKLDASFFYFFLSFLFLFIYLFIYICISSCCTDCCSSSYMLQMDVGSTQKFWCTLVSAVG